jgi:16S rRNA (cytosine1402-N4)-methyltransferase
MIVDGTFGGGGYTTAFLNHAPCRVIAFDRDPAAKQRYQAMPAPLKERCLFIDAPFSQMIPQLAQHQIDQVDAVVLDLGVSSPQLDVAERGFSFRLDGPLDMRMDPRRGLSAADVINTHSADEIANIIYQYGEDRQSRRIARAIVAARQIAPITTTGALATVIRRVIPLHPRDLSDPCTRTFQALRIFVNGELDELQQVLAASLSVLKTGGRLVVVSFHSLEDRIVKQFMAQHGGRTRHTTRHAPAVQAAPIYLRLDQYRAISASNDEITRNPRSRSAHLRVAIRTDQPLKA